MHTSYLSLCFLFRFFYRLHFMYILHHTRVAQLLLRFVLFVREEKLITCKLLFLDALSLLKWLYSRSCFRFASFFFFVSLSLLEFPLHSFIRALRNIRFSVFLIFFSFFSPAPLYHFRLPLCFSRDVIRASTFSYHCPSRHLLATLFPSLSHRSPRPSSLDIY